MKLSSYNIKGSRDGRVIIFNTFRNTYTLLPNHIYQKLLDGTFLNNLRNEPNNILDRLYRAGVIIDDEMDEYQCLVQEYKKEIHESRTYNLTLLPSLDCNLRCWYCYEKHIKGSHMTPDVQNRIVKHVESVFERNPFLNCLNVEMFGGEPLLYFESELYPTLTRIKDHILELKKHVNFLFITNGVRINEYNIQKFSDLNASFQISIDGYKTTHDKVKFIKGKGGTYDQIINVIHLLTRQEGFMFVNLRINYDDETLKHLPKIIKDLQDVDRDKISIHLERIWQTESKRENTSDILKEVINEFILNGFDVSYMNLSRRHYSCKASKTMQSVISYDGSIYKCTGRDFTKDHQEGILDDYGNITWDEEKYQKRIELITFDNPQCRSCKLLPLCWGPCCQKLLETGKADISRYCQIQNMEMALNDYVIYRFNNHYTKQNRKKI